MLHIDAHYDTNLADQSIVAVAEDLENLRALSFAEYHALSFDSDYGQIRVFRWDNYLTIYQRLFGTLVDEWIFSTYDMGIPPSFKVKNSHQKNC